MVFIDYVEQDMTAASSERLLLVIAWEPVMGEEELILSELFLCVLALLNGRWMRSTAGCEDRTSLRGQSPELKVDRSGVVAKGTLVDG